MEIADEDLVQFMVVRDRILDCFDGGVVPLDVEVVTHGLALRGETVQDEAAGLAVGERVAFDGVRVVVRFQPELLLDLAENVRREGTQGVEFFFEPGDRVKRVGHVTPNRYLPSDIPLVAEGDEGALEGLDSAVDLVVGVGG